MSEIVHLNYPDGYLVPSLDLRRDITRQIGVFRPDLVITQNPQRRVDHNPFIGHPDHLATGEATLAAVYCAARDHLNFPELWRDEHLEPWKVPQVLLTGVEEPNLWLDIGDHLRARHRVDLAHASQVDPEDDRGAHAGARARGGGASGHRAGAGVRVDHPRMTRRGGGGEGSSCGGPEPDLTRRPGSEGPTFRRIAGFFEPYRGAWPSSRSSSSSRSASASSTRSS